MEPILEIIKEILGSTAFIGGAILIGVIAGALFLAWWGRGIKEKVDRVDGHEKTMDEFRRAVAKLDNLPCANHGEDIHRHEEEMAEFRRAVAKLDNLPCANHGEDIRRHETGHHELESRMSKVETAVEFLQKSVDDLTKNLKVGGTGLILGSYTQNHSPLSITDEGRKMMQRVGMGEMFDQNWDRIEKLISDSLEDKNAYDIDQFCMEQAVVFPEKFLGKEDISVLKDDAYKQGLSLTSYMRVVAVLARNRYMEEHKIEVKEPAETV